MALDSEKIEIKSHPHPLGLNPPQGPYHCGGCKEYELDLRTCYQCENWKCDYQLHKECVPTPYPFWLTLIKCDLFFKEDSGGKNLVCDACGKDVKGSFYEGFSRNKRHHILHPCCAKLDFKREEAHGSVVVYLKEETPQRCLVCGVKGNSRHLKSWVYVSRCGKYCYHVACVKGKVEKWKKDEGSTTSQQSHGAAGTSSGALTRVSQSQNIKRAGGRVGAALDFLEMAIDIFSFVVSLIFGVSIPVPLAQVCKWLK